MLGSFDPDGELEEVGGSIVVVNAGWTGRSWCESPVRIEQLRLTGSHCQIVLFLRHVMKQDVGSFGDCVSSSPMAKQCPALAARAEAVQWVSCI